MDLDDKSRANKGNEIKYKGKKHYIVYESDSFVLISKYKSLKKAFSVTPNQITWVKKS
jgi:hypothetical protein